MAEQQAIDDRFAKFADEPAAKDDQSLDQRFQKFATASVADRHNNPLNIKLGPLTKHYVDEGSAKVGESATDGGQFLRFESPDDGYAAAHNLLLSPAYKDLPVDAAMKKWSNGGYGAAVAPALSPSAKISDLSLEDRQSLVEAMAKREGYSGAAGGEESDALTSEDHAALQTKFSRQAMDQSARTDAFARSIKPSTSQPPSFAETAAKLQEPISKRILGFSLSDVADKYFPEKAPKSATGYAADSGTVPTAPVGGREAVRRTAKTVAGFMDFMQSPEALAAALAETVTAGGATPVVASLMGAQFATQGGKEAVHALDDMRTNGVTPENSEQFFGGLAVGVGGLIGPAAIREGNIRAKAAAAKALAEKEKIRDIVTSALQDHLTNAGTPTPEPEVATGAIDSQPELAASSAEAKPEVAKPEVAEATQVEQPPASLEQRFAAHEPIEERFAGNDLTDDDYLEMADRAAEKGEKPPVIPEGGEEPEIAAEAPPVKENEPEKPPLLAAVDQLKEAPIREKSPEVVRDPEFQAYAGTIRSLAERNLPELTKDVDAAIDLYDSGKPGEAMTKLEIARQELHGAGKRLAEAAAKKAGVELPEDFGQEAAAPTEAPPQTGNELPVPEAQPTEDTARAPENTGNAVPASKPTDLALKLQEARQAVEGHQLTVDLLKDKQSSKNPVARARYREAVKSLNEAIMQEVAASKARLEEMSAEKAAPTEAAEEPPMTRDQIIDNGAEYEMDNWASAVRDAQDQLKRGESAQSTESNAAGKEIEERAGSHASAIRSSGAKEGGPLAGFPENPSVLAEAIESRGGKKPGSKKWILYQDIRKAFRDAYEQVHGEDIDNHLAERDASFNEAREPESADADISFGFGPEAGRSPALDYFVRKLSAAYDALRDYVTIDAVPQLTKAGVQKEAVAHAVSRVAVPRMINDMLARVFPEDFKNPAKMARAMRVMALDNILGAYDQLKTSAAFAWQRGDYTAMDRFLKLAERAEQKHDLADYAKEVQQALTDPEIRGATERWKAVVNSTMDALYNEAKGMDPAYPRDGRGRYTGARVNLLAKEHVPEWLAAITNEDKPVPEPAASNYRNPSVRRDRFDRLAKLTAAEYSDDPVAVLGSALYPRYNEVTKLRLYKSLIEKGAAEWEKPAGGTINGEDARALPVQVPETKDGVTKQVTKMLWVPKSLVQEIRGVLGTDMPLGQNPVAAALTKLQLAQFADAATHLKNIHSVIAAAQGTKSLLTDIGRKFPGISSVDSFARIGKVMYDIYQDTPEIRAELSQMAKQGMLRQHFPSTGFQKLTKMQDLIHSVDTASRVVMNRFYDNLVDRGMAVDTPQSRRMFVQQIGEYNRRIMGPLQRAAAQSGLSPFIVAGRTFNRFSRRLLTGNPGFEATSTAAAAKARMVNLVTLGSMVTIPVMWNLMRTGSIAGRAGTPAGAIDLGMPNDARGNHKVLDLWQLYGMRRGARTIGLDSLVNGMVNKTRANDIVGTAISDATNSAIHPWLGPAPGFVFSALTGSKLDMRGGPVPEQAQRMDGKASQYLENLRVAAKNQNLLLYSPLRKAFGDVEQTPSKDFLKDFLKAPQSAVGISDRQTPAIQMAHELATRVPTTPAQKDRSQLRRALLAAYDTGDQKQIDQAREAARGKVSPTDLTDIGRERRMTPIERASWREPLSAIVKMWEVATPEEKVVLRRLMSQKVANSNPTTEGRERALSILRGPGR